MVIITEPSKHVQNLPSRYEVFGQISHKRWSGKVNEILSKAVQWRGSSWPRGEFFSIFCCSGNVCRKQIHTVWLACRTWPDTRTFWCYCVYHLEIYSILWIQICNHCDETEIGLPRVREKYGLLKAVINEVTLFQVSDITDFRLLHLIRTEWELMK